MILKYQVVSDMGCVRTNNEDMALVAGGFYRDTTDTWTLELQPQSRFTAIIADGMGGYEGGEIASEMALKSFDKFVVTLPGGLQVGELVTRVKEWVPAIHGEILNYSIANPQYEGMGTTLVGIFFYAGEVLRINIGDSRLYRFRHGILKQLSTDHSMRQLTGDMSQPSNMIYNSLGGGERAFADVDVMTGQFIDNDIFIICSDGLSDMISDDEISAILEAGGDAQALVDAAKAAGGRDNVSVIMLTICDASQPHTPVVEDEALPEVTDTTPHEPAPTTPASRDGAVTSLLKKK